MDWTPAPLLRNDSRILMRVIAFCAIARGWDYLTPPGAGSIGQPGLAVVEAAAPLWLWGAVFMLGGVILALGMLIKHHFTVWAGLAWLATFYVPLSVGVILGAMAQPWLEGLRGGTVLILPATLTIMLALRTGPRPLSEGARREVAVVEGPSDS